MARTKNSNKAETEVVAAKTVPPAVEAIRLKLLELKGEMTKAFYERDTEADALVTAVVAGQHIYALGPPGTGKSLLTKFFSEAFTGTKYFEILCMTTTPPEEFFGPTSVKGLLEDRFERRIEGYLPDADIAFIDEIFKCNAAALNGLLKILNEREFKNGTQLLKVPLLSAMTASNELPQEDNLLALFDRILVRLSTKYIQELDNVVQLLTRKMPKVQVRLTLDELKQAIAAADEVEVPLNVAAQAAMLREKVTAVGMRCSDRRLKQAMSLVKAHAFLHGRMRANVADLAPLRHVFWENETQIPKVFDIVMEVVNPLESKSREIMGAIRVAIKEVEKATPENHINVAVETIASINAGIEQLEALIEEALTGGHDTAALEEAANKARTEAAAIEEKYIGKALRAKSRKGKVA